MKNILIILSILLLFRAQQSTADTLPAYVMEPITVTANRTVSSGDETGTFEVITHEIIQQGNYKSVSEVLQSVPGVYFATESFLGNRQTESNTGPKIRIRGKGAKLLIDGRPMNMTIYGCLINNMLTLDHVERIEVTRGSESVLYGSDGLGGVINIITRDPGELGTGFSVKGGSHSTLISGLEHENTIGSFGYFISGSFKRSDGYRGDSDFRDESGFAKLVYEINPSVKLESSLNMYNGDWDDPGTITNPRTDYWMNLKRRQADVTLKGRTETVTYSIKAFHNEGHHIFSDQDGWHSRDVTDAFRTEMVKNFSEGMNRLTVGADGRWIGGKALVDENTYNNKGFKFWLNNEKWYRENEMAVFASDRHVLMDGRVSIIGGVRIVNNSGFGSFFCPKLGATLYRAKSSFRIGYNRAFRTPSLLQTHLHKKSNSDLYPELADHFEIGTDYSFTESLAAGAAVFYIDGTNQVEMEFANGTPLGFDNIGEWKHKGGELNISWKPSSRLSLGAGYTYIDVGSNTQYNPKHQATMRAGTGWKLFGRDLSLNLHGLGISSIYAANNSKNRLDDYFLLDLYTDWRIYEHGSLLIGINNLLDKEYESVEGYRFPGTVITAGIRLER